MGYNLKSARNEESISKISKWLSLGSLALKSKFGRQFELLENLEYMHRNSCWRARPCSQATFSIQIFLIFTKFKPFSHSLMPGASNLAIVFDMLFPFLAFLKLQPIVL